MFLTDQLVFLQMQKTACSHISEILKDYFNGKQIGKHGPLTFDPGDRRILGSIRNPYDWYVSLWSYGCIGKGAIHSRLTNSRGSAIRMLLRERVRRPADWPVLAPILRAEVARDPRQFRALYNDPNDPELFRAWLRRVLDGPQRPFLEGDYPFLPLADRVGLMSYRFLHLFTRYDAWEAKRRTLRDPVAVRAFYDEAAICSEFVRTERLEEDLAAVLRGLGIRVTANDLRRDKVNVSNHRPSADYFDNETAALVADRDWLICELFGYGVNDSKAA